MTSSNNKIPARGWGGEGRGEKWSKEKIVVKKYKTTKRASAEIGGFPGFVAPCLEFTALPWVEYSQLEMIQGLAALCLQDVPQV